jgi:hypothetical protein
MLSQSKVYTPYKSRGSDFFYDNAEVVWDLRAIMQCLRDAFFLLDSKKIKTCFTFEFMIGLFSSEFLVRSDNHLIDLIRRIYFTTFVLQNKWITQQVCEMITVFFHK